LGVSQGGLLGEKIDINTGVKIVNVQVIYFDKNCGNKKNIW
jgi:hypothetical protein